MNKFISEAKLHALFYNWLTRRSGVWIAVLLIHFFLWIALNHGRDIPQPRQVSSIYLSIIPIVLNDSSVLAPRLVRNSLKDISIISSKLIRKRQHVSRDKEVLERKATVPEASINRQRSTDLLDPEKISELQIPPSQLGPDGDPKRTKILNYEEMKQIALSIAHEPQSRLLPGTDKKISGAQKFAEAIDHAKRGDCRFEHAHLGILAIPFLLKDTLTDEGCKW